MRLDVDRLANRITDDHVMLESVSVYYNNTTKVSLLPQPDDHKTRSQYGQFSNH